MSMAPTIIHGRTVQGIAYRKDQKGPGLDGIVQLKINIGRDGRVDHVKVLSGDEQFVQAAKEYVKRANFGPLPSIPQLANAKREWELEVAFFTPKQ
jgi:TonB family protein